MMSSDSVHPRGVNRNSTPRSYRWLLAAVVATPGLGGVSSGQLPTSSVPVPGWHRLWSVAGVGFDVVTMRDQDGDGILDLAATGVTLPNSHAILSGASGVVRRVGVGCPFVGGPKVANVGDINGDGVNDLAFFGEIDGGPSPLCVVSGRDNTLLFAAPSQGPLPESRAVAALGLSDLNGDGFGDFAVGSGLLGTESVALIMPFTECLLKSRS